MRERGVRVVFSPETPRRDAATKWPARSAGASAHSNGATNERMSAQPRRARTGDGGPHVTSDLPAHLRKRLPDETRLKRAGMLFALLADHQRLKILVALRAGHELCVGEAARLLGVSVSVASHHLRRLRDLGILGDRSDGKLAKYSLRERWLADLATTALARCRPLPA
jgi:DNA-binding transcriptional ArsR family regulator